MTLYTLNWNVIFRSKIRQNGLSKYDFLTQCALFILFKEKKEHHAKRNFLNAWISTVAVLNFSVSIWTNLNIYFDFRWAGPRKGEIQGHLWRTRPDLRRDVRLLKKSSILQISNSQIFSFAKTIFRDFCPPSI